VRADHLTPAGRQSFYRLAVPELEQVLRSAEAVLAVTGDAVELCPTYGSRAEGAGEQGRP
jgi:ArsR family transcriptional regulator